LDTEVNNHEKVKMCILAIVLLASLCVGLTGCDGNGDCLVNRWFTDLESLTQASLVTSDSEHSMTFITLASDEPEIGQLMGYGLRFMLDFDLFYSNEDMKNYYDVTYNGDYPAHTVIYRNNGNIGRYVFDVLSAYGEYNPPLDDNCQCRYCTLVRNNEPHRIEVCA